MYKKKIIMFFSTLKFAYLGKFRNFVIPYCPCNLSILHLLVKDGYFFYFEFLSINQILIWFKYNQIGYPVLYNFLSFVKMSSLMPISLKKVQSLNFSNSISTYIIYSKTLGYLTLKDADFFKTGGFLICKFN